MTEARCDFGCNKLTEGDVRKFALRSGYPLQVALVGGYKASSITTIGDFPFVAVIGQNMLYWPGLETLEFANVRSDIRRLGDIADGVLQRIASKQYFPFRQPQYIPVGAMNIEVMQLNLCWANNQIELPFEQPVRHNQR